MTVSESSVRFSELFSRVTTICCCLYNYILLIYNAYVEKCSFDKNYCDGLLRRWLRFEEEPVVIMTHVCCRCISHIIYISDRCMEYGPVMSHWFKRGISDESGFKEEPDSKGNH